MMKSLCFVQLIVSCIAFAPSLTIRLSWPALSDLKARIEAEIRSTDRGLAATTEQRDRIELLVQELERKCPLAEPARSPLMAGKWIVDYSTAPPPSNGKLGPFMGIARQIIDLEKGTYVNYLSVPGDVSKEWLSATLNAKFQEWDGNLLDANSVTKGSTTSETMSPRADKMTCISLNSKSPFSVSTIPDHGATSWKVDFKLLTIRLFGLPLFSKIFEGTSRVWKMTYLDEETRIGTTFLRLSFMLQI